ncbi:MAG: hypothetical protein V7L07_02415 [Nostoc sp.]
MLHVWIDGKPFIDASYSCLCPAIAMLEAGYQEVIAIAREQGRPIPKSLPQVCCNQCRSFRWRSLS